MDWTKATKEQLWTILKADSDCPLPLLEGAFQEALNRGMIEQFIGSVMKKKGLINNEARKILNLSHEDLIQIGYEGALDAIRDFKPGKSGFTHFLFLNIAHKYGKQFTYAKAEKRQREECSFDTELVNYYLADNKTNVEKAVITKLEFEEKISLLSQKQKSAFLLFFKGYTYTEIAEQMNSKKDTIADRVQAAFVKMTGHKVNLIKLGIYEKASYKKQGA